MEDPKSTVNIEDWNGSRKTSLIENIDPFLAVRALADGASIMHLHAMDRIPSPFGWSGPRRLSSTSSKYACEERHRLKGIAARRKANKAARKARRA